jgi:hypothetical protein
MAVWLKAPEGSIFSLDLIRMDFPDKASILKDVLALLRAQYKNNGFLENFPLGAHRNGCPSLRSSKVASSSQNNIVQNNLLLQHLILQYFVSVPPSPSLATRYQMYSDLGQAYGRKRLLSDEEINSLMTKYYSRSLQKFLSNPVIEDCATLYEIMQSMKMYDLFHLFDRIQSVGVKIAEENAKGSEEMSNRRLLRLLELDRRRGELSMEEVVESFLPIKENYERDLAKIHEILEGDQSFMEEFPLLAATVNKDFEFASLLSVPPFNEELAQALITKRGGTKRKYRTTRKNKGSNK